MNTNYRIDKISDLNEGSQSPQHRMRGDSYLHVWESMLSIFLVQGAFLFSGIPIRILPLPRKVLYSSRLRSI